MSSAIQIAGLLMVGLLIGTGSGLGLGYVGFNPQVNDLQKQLKTTQASLGDFQKSVAEFQKSLADERELTSNLRKDLQATNSTLISTQRTLTDATRERNVAQAQLTTALQDKASLQTQLSQTQSQVTALQQDKTSLQNQLAQLQASQPQVSALQNQISSLNSQISNLNSIVNLQASQTLRSQTTINIPANQGLFFTYSNEIRYAGYLMISYTATGNVHIQVKSSSVTFTTPSQSIANNIRIPVIPGESWQITVVNESFFAGTTVTITITYVY